MYVYIVAVIISITLIAILFFALRSTVKRIDYNTKKYFIDKLQDYDYLIEEKKKILEELDLKIKNNKEVLSKEREESTKDQNVEKIKNETRMKIPKYSDEDLFKKYKYIKNKFSFSKEKLIKKFLRELKPTTTIDYDILKKIRKKISNDRVYEIIKLRMKDQINYIFNLLTEEEINYVKKYLDFKNFKINIFLTKIDTLIDKNDPIIYIYTGERFENFNYISPNICTKYDETINEGIKIGYKGILYDYSL